VAAQATASATTWHRAVRTRQWWLSARCVRAARRAARVRNAPLPRCRRLLPTPRRRPPFFRPQVAAGCPGTAARKRTRGSRGAARRVRAGRRGVSARGRAQVAAGLTTAVRRRRTRRRRYYPPPALVKGRGGGLLAQQRGLWRRASTGDKHYGPPPRLKSGGGCICCCLV
jgi:hypothetical protein